MDECSDRILLRDSYVALESLRNSHDLLSQQMALWVRERLRLVPARDEAWVQGRRTLLHALSVELQTVEMIASDLQLEWVGGELLASQTPGLPGDLIYWIVTALDSAFRFVKFTTSRWLTIGTSARSLVVALHLGLDDLVRFITSRAKGLVLPQGLRAPHHPPSQILRSERDCLPRSRGGASRATGG